MASDFTLARLNMVESQIRTADVTDLPLQDVYMAAKVAFLLEDHEEDDDECDSDEEHDHDHDCAHDHDHSHDHDCGHDHDH